MPRKSTLRRLVDFPAPTPQSTPCRIWQGGSLNNRGYGQRPDGRFAHRWVVETAGVDHFGTDFAPELHVLHHCDNPPCFRYDHLFLGTRSDNMADMHQKGRGRSGVPGARNGRAKLTEDNVRLILSSSLTHRELATIYGVSRSLISTIKRREVWKHIPIPSGAGQLDPEERWYALHDGWVS